MVIIYNAQGYEMTKNILFQDNESEINMEKNEWKSKPGNSRHNNIQHFFVKDGVYKRRNWVTFLSKALDNPWLLHKAIQRKFILVISWSYHGI